MNSRELVGKLLSAQLLESLYSAVSRAPKARRAVFSFEPRAYGQRGRMHSRRSVLRTFFRFARELDLLRGEPSLDVVLPAKSNLSTRPLTADAVSLCRSYAFISLTRAKEQLSAGPVGRGARSPVGRDGVATATEIR